MFGRNKIINVVLMMLIASSIKAEIVVNNKGNVPLFEDKNNPGEKIYELTGLARQTTTKHSVALVDFDIGASSTPHSHNKTEESYYVLSGEGKIIINGETAPIKTGDLVVIPIKSLHQVINTSKTEELKLLVTAAKAWTIGDMILPENNKN